MAGNAKGGANLDPFLNDGNMRIFIVAVAEADRIISGTRNYFSGELASGMDG